MSSLSFADFQCEAWLFEHQTKKSARVQLKPTSFDPEFFRGTIDKFVFTVDSYYFKKSREMRLFIFNDHTGTVSHSLQRLAKANQFMIEQKAIHRHQQDDQITVAVKCFN